MYSAAQKYTYDMFALPIRRSHSVSLLTHVTPLTMLTDDDDVCRGEAQCNRHSAAVCIGFVSCRCPFSSVALLVITHVCFLPQKMMTANVSDTLCVSDSRPGERSKRQ